MKKIKFLILIPIVIIVLVVEAVVVYKIAQKDNPIITNKPENIKDEETPNDVTISYEAFNDFNNILITIHNDAEKVYSYKLKVEFKDNNGKIADSKEYSVPPIAPNGDYGLLITTPDIEDLSEDKITINYEKKEVEVLDNYLLDKTKIVLSSEKTDDGYLNVSAKNKTGNDINMINVMIKFYEKDNLVHVTFVSFDELKNDSELSEKILLPEGISYDKLDTKIIVLM